MDYCYEHGQDLLLLMPFSMDDMFQRCTDCITSEQVKENINSMQSMFQIYIVVLVMMKRALYVKNIYLSFCVFERH